MGTWFSPILTIQIGGNKKKEMITISFPLLAVRRGLEPLTPCVTGTYSNQLN